MLTLLHNPRCSKSREALTLVTASGKPHQVRLYLDTPLTEAEIRELLRKLNLPAAGLVRTKEDEFKALGLDTASVTEDQLIRAMADHPRLIERPVLDDGVRAVIGRPVENLQDLLK